MKQMRDCDECVRLWHEYSVATSEYIRLDNKLGIAALAHDDEAVSILAPDVEAAVVRRAQGRDAIRKHEAAAHPQLSDAMEA